MTKKISLCYVSGNTYKFQQAATYVQKHMPEIILVQKDIDLTEIQSLDHEVVAVDKACRAWQHVQKPILIDDGGIYFERYHLFPGVLTKYVYKGIGQEGFMRLVDVGDRAEFLSYLVYCMGPTENDCQVFIGRCPGEICYDTENASSLDVPYDILFSPDGFDGSFAALRGMDREEEFSYRVDALQKFVAWYRQL